MAAVGEGAASVLDCWAEAERRGCIQTLLNTVKLFCVRRWTFSSCSLYFSFFSSTVRLCCDLFSECSNWIEFIELQSRSLFIWYMFSRNITTQFGKSPAGGAHESEDLTSRRPDHLIPVSSLWSMFSLYLDVLFLLLNWAQCLFPRVFKLSELMSSCLCDFGFHPV